MSLLDDVSIVVTPNGYKAGELYAVVPVPTLGTELVTNGDFATDSGWTKGTSWTIGGGVATSDGGNSTLTQNIAFVLGRNYLISFNVSRNSGTLFVRNVSSTTIHTIDVNNNVSFQSFTYAATSSNGYINFYSYDYNGTIDNVSIKELTSADMDVTRATAATRVDENGLVNYALGVEEVTNGDFSNGSTDWTPYGSTLVVSNANPYNGNDTALFTALGVGGANITQSISTVVGNTYHLSCYAQYNSGDQSQIEIVGVLEYPNGIGITSGVTTFTYLQTSFTATSTTSVITVRERGGSNNASCYLYDISIKEVNNVPRIDYTGGGCPHILAEPQRTNIAQYSEQLDVAPNVIDNANYTSNFYVSPNGLTTAPKFEETTANDRHGFYQYQTVTSNSYTVSIYTKQINRRYICLQSDLETTAQYTFFDLQLGTVVSEGTGWTATIDSVGSSGWYRLTATCTAVAGSRYFIWGCSLDGLSNTYVGDGSLFTFWGLQVEEGSYATSYIPTVASTVTRNQDIFTRDGIGSLINSTEGVLFVEMAALSNDSTYRLMNIRDVSNTDNFIYLGYKDASNTIRTRIEVGGVASTDMEFVLSNETEFNKIAIKWKTNDFALWVNGVEVATDSSGVSFTANTLDELSFDRNGSLEFNGKVKQLQVYDTSLSDTQLAALTS